MSALHYVPSILLLMVVTLLVNSNRVPCDNCCYNCNGVATQEECEQITKCGRHETCYVRKKTALSLNVLYESGCLSDKVCNVLHSIQQGTIGKRDHSLILTNCYECCSSNNTAPCNRDLCTPNPPVLPPGYKICYACYGAKKPEECDKTITCTTDQSCHVHARLSFGYDALRYDLGCQSKSVCATLEKLNQVHINASTSIHTIKYCQQCCDENYCNIGKCGFLQTTLPLFDKLPNNRTVLPGSPYDTVTLDCKTAAASNANITWTFESTNGQTTIPSRVQIRKISPTESLLKIENIQTDILGKWTCVATNAAGSSKADAYLKV